MLEGPPDPLDVFLFSRFQIRHITSHLFLVWNVERVGIPYSCRARPPVPEENARISGSSQTRGTSKRVGPAISPPTFSLF